ncbi:MAG: Asp-tRNA(Asn)/Glu-tRNA(Gln) amidotransferase subunit GatC [Planctomycetales bacterium]|nr:Asp-tRNA(Asn)/Glu-tRNA(Gln) amidotransferase subunit GatC [Planctomycetales bacterium]
MRLTHDDVRKVALLARLKMTDADVARLADELTAIVHYVDVLKDIDTTGIEPMVHSVELLNVLREDILGTCLTREAALRNAPRSDGKFFLVPAMIDAQ